MGTLRILAVDDSHDVTDSLAMILKLNGLEVEVAYDGNQALQLASAREYDVVLLDLAMPKTDGLKVVEKIKKDSRCTHSLLIAITGYGDEKHRQLTESAGFHHHLLKPVNPTDLLELLESARRKDPEK
jgi:CheY-like chemotaxis protein